MNMGIISRKVLPVCGNLCVFCPELRARSRQPVKRYKMLLADIFPKPQRMSSVLKWFKCFNQRTLELQDEPANDRKIGKLIEYASKNPLRIPKIAAGLEQRGCKALRSERYSPVRIVMRAYSKLLSSCRDQMPLFAPNALSMIRVLMEQARSDFLQVLACLTLVDFLNNQTDCTYVRDLDALLPKLCALSRETGEDHRRLPLRAAGLQSLASLINFMGKYCHMPADFDDIVTVVLENYESPLPDQDMESRETGEADQHLVKGVMKGRRRGPIAVMTRAVTRLQSHREDPQCQRSSNLTRLETEAPKVWSQVCIENMARLAKEATTIRRVLEPMLRYFDAGKQWPPQKLALTVLRDMQQYMEKSGSDQLSLPVLVRHLDHKNVANNSQLQTSIVEAVVILARQSKGKATVAIVGSMNDIFRHLRKCIHSRLEASRGATIETHNPDTSLQLALEECFLELAKKVGDAAPLIDMIASSLGRLPSNPVTARSTAEAVCVLAFCVAYGSDQSYAEQIFPEALFQELLQAMVHPDDETRVKAHHIFAQLLVPSSLITRSTDLATAPSLSKACSVPSRHSSEFGSAAVMMEQLREHMNHAEGATHVNRGRQSRENIQTIEMTHIGWARSKHMASVYPLGSFPGHGLSAGVEHPWEMSMERSVLQLRRQYNSLEELRLSTVRLNGLQASLLLSALWHEAILPDNVPSNYEAISSSYILTLYFSRAKTSSHKTAIRAFQLALSLRSLTIGPGDVYLPPSRRRSLFTLSTAMLVFAGKVYNVPQLGTVVKASLTSTTRDPYLELSDDVRLKLVNSSAGFVNVEDYGSAADDRDAFKSFSGFSLSDEQTPEALAALIVGSSAVLGPDDFAVADQMLQPFSAQEGYEIVLQFPLGTPHLPGSPLESRDSLSFDETIQPPDSSLGDDLKAQFSAVELISPVPANVCVPPVSPRIMGVSQLLESALVTAGQVASTSAIDSLSYNTMATQCQTFSADSRRKISSVLKLDGEKSSPQLTCLDCPPGGPRQEQLQHGQFQELFRLPPASPYDNFLKAAGC